MDAHVQEWLRYAESAMKSAEVLRRVGEHLNAIFHLQQAVEKTLKALLLKQTNEQPPRIHDLRILAERCGLALTTEHGLLLEKLGSYYVESRYPSGWAEVPPDVYSKEAKRLNAAAKEFIRWLRSRI